MITGRSKSELGIFFKYLDDKPPPQLIQNSLVRGNFSIKHGASEGISISC